MKTRPESSANNATNPAPVKSKTGHKDTISGHIPPELEPLAKLLNFTPLQMLAFELAVEFDGQTPEKYIRQSTLDFLEATFEWIEERSKNETHEDHARAKHILETITPAFENVLDSAKDYVEKSAAPGSNR